MEPYRRSRAAALIAVGRLTSPHGQAIRIEIHGWRVTMADWVKRTQPIQVGDSVAYSKTFLQSTGQYTGDVPHARGKVTALKELSKEVTLAEIEWDKPDLPGRVNVKNLTTIKGIALGE